MLLSYVSFKKQPISTEYKTFNKNGEVTIYSSLHKNNFMDFGYEISNISYISSKNNSKTIIGGKCVQIEKKIDKLYRNPNDHNQFYSLCYLSYMKPYSTELAIIEMPKHININTSISLFKHNIKLIYEPISIEISVKDNGLGNGMEQIGNLEMSIEIQRLEEKKIKFPKGYLDGLKPSSIATKELDTLILYSPDIGKTILYTDKGTIEVIILPGYKTNKKGNRKF